MTGRLSETPTKQGTDPLSDQTPDLKAKSPTEETNTTPVSPNPYDTSAQTTITTTELYEEINTDVPTNSAVATPDHKHAEDATVKVSKETVLAAVQPEQVCHLTHETAEEPDVVLDEMVSCGSLRAQNYKRQCFQ